MTRHYLFGSITAKVSLFHTAAFGHFHHLIPSSSTSVIDTFLARGIGRIAFIRHGNTAPSTTGSDFDRQLTPLGERQAKVAGASYGTSILSPFYSKILSSPAPRCVRTAGLFLESAAAAASADAFADAPPTDSQSDNNNNGTDKGRRRQRQRQKDAAVGLPVQLNLLAQLYDGTMQPEGSRLFRKHGYAPLRTYLEDPNTDDAEIASMVLGQYASGAMDAMIRTTTTSANNGNNNTTATRKTSSLSECPEQEEEKQLETLLLFGHAIYLPAVALLVATTVKCDSVGQDLILETNTREVEGFAIDLIGREVRLLRRPPHL